MARCTVWPSQAVRLCPSACRRARWLMATPASAARRFAHSAVGPTNEGMLPTFAVFDEVHELLGNKREQVESEVDRYCSWPGQACGYKVGHTEINRQPYLVDFGAQGLGLQWVTVAEPYGRAFAARKSEPKILLGASAVVMGLLGAGASFAPHETLAFAGEPSGETATSALSSDGSNSVSSSEVKVAVSLSTQPWLITPSCSSLPA